MEVLITIVPCKRSYKAVHLLASDPETMSGSSSDRSLYETEGRYVQ